MTRSPLGPEARLLALSAGGHENDEAIRRLAGGDFDWRVLAALAVRSNAAAVLLRRLKGMELEPRPADVREDLVQIAMVTDFRQAHLEARLKSALDELAEAEIEVLLLKGAALASTVYGSFTDRPMRDADLLVQSGDAPRAQALMAAAKWNRPEPELAHRYRKHHHLPPLHDQRGTGVAIEIHTELFPSGHPFGLTAAILWRDSSEIDIAGRKVRIPSIHHQLLHLCLHFAWSHWFRSAGWRTLRDLGTIMSSRAVDWPVLVELARENRAGTCCYWTFRLAQDLARIPIPPDVSEALEPNLPSALDKPLRRHLALESFSAGAECPSTTLDFLMWNLAIQPSASGHGVARPWHMGTAAPVEGEHGGASRTGRSLLRHLGSLPAWWRYLASLL